MHGAGTQQQAGIASASQRHFDLVCPLAAHSIAPSRAGHTLAVANRGDDALVAQILEALRYGRGLIIAGRAELLLYIYDTTTTTNPIVYQPSPPGYLSTKLQDIHQLSARAEHWLA